MKKRYLLLLFFAFVFSFSNAQSNSTNQQPIQKTELKSAQPTKQSVQKKSPVKKAVKVKMIDVEKEKATTSPKQKAKLEDSNI